MSLTTRGAAKSRARYVMDPASKLTLNADIGESIGLGVRPGDESGDTYLLHQVGVVQTAFPVYVVGSAIAGGKVFSADDIVAAFAETGKLAGLKSALAAHDKREKAKAEKEQAAAK